MGTPALGRLQLRAVRDSCGATLQDAQLRSVMGPGLSLLLTQLPHLSRLAVGHLLSAPPQDM